MRYRDYYLIEYGDNKRLVLAESTKEALDLCFEDEKQDRKKDDYRRLEFDPPNLKITKICRESDVVMAAE